MRRQKHTQASARRDLTLSTHDKARRSAVLSYLSITLAQCEMWHLAYMIELMKLELIKKRKINKLWLSTPSQRHLRSETEHTWQSPQISFAINDGPSSPGIVHILELMKIECTKNIFNVTPSTHDRAHRFAGPSYLVLPLPTPKTIWQWAHMTELID